MKELWVKAIPWKKEIALTAIECGADALWVEAWHPWRRTWIPLDPAHPHGYGRKFPKKRMTVVALENAKGNFVNRTQFYKCTNKHCLD